jgi:type II secretory ATPase GspE/PulE/Tfp pilus assembly ATPase PilB-like protein
MVGEIRDSETAQIAIRAALTGHQVFSTLHTNDASGAVTRLLDMGVEPFLVSSSVEGVLAQRLVRRICSQCRVPFDVPTAMIEKLDDSGFGRVAGHFYRGTGCEACRGTGYRGRIGIFEFLPIGTAVRQLILESRSSAEIQTVARRTMKTMRQDALQKAAEGVTTLDEILRIASGDAME